MGRQSIFCYLRGIFIRHFMSKRINNVAVIDLFCGIGGLSHGFVKEDFKVVAGIDIDETCKYSFEANNNSTFISKSISDISKEEINKLNALLER